MEGDYKIIEFDKYCPTCENKDKPDSEDPCDECLDTPVNVDSRKPINYKKKEI